jgi:hypothetical protein
MLPQRNQTKGARNSLSGSSASSWALKLCLGKEKAGASQVFIYNFLTISSTENSSPRKIHWA